MIISHRGLYNGNQFLANDPKSLPLDKWKCEVDLWKVGRELALGHDGPEYEITRAWLVYNNPNILWHAKNIEAFIYLRDTVRYSHYFWHQNDDYATTNQGIIIVYPGKALVRNAIVMKPELYPYELLKESKPYAVCTDFPENFSEFA